MDQQDMIRFILKERESIKSFFDQGVYSLEFALGQMTAMSNLASMLQLKNLVVDIRNDIEYLGAIQWRKNRSLELASHSSTIDNVSVWKN